MLFDAIVNGVNKVLGWVLNLIPDVNIDLSAFTEKFTWLIDKTKAMNAILPLKEALIFCGILLTIKFAILMFWLAQRAINLLRGAG